MRSPRNQFILLGLICQGLSWDDTYAPLLLGAIWLAFLIPKRPVQVPQAVDGIVLIALSIGAFYVAKATGRSGHFFLGMGLAGVQLVRLLRPLSRRDKMFSVLIAFFHLGVGCTVILDYRFLPIFMAAVVLIPKVFIELEMDEWKCAPVRPRLGMAAYGGIVVATVIFYMAFPRGFLGGAIRPVMAANLNQGTLAESVLDPTRSGSAQSSRTLLQIEGEQLGYLRSFTLENFDGGQWTPPKLGPLTPLPPPRAEQRERALQRRVRVSQVGYLGRVLPTDGRVLHVAGPFFRGPMQNVQGAIECQAMWNTSQNFYDYWIDPAPEVEKLSPIRKRILSDAPPPSPRVRAWLDEVGAPGSTPLEKARLLEANLRRNFTYTLGAPELSRVNYLEHFLFDQKQGHCERFAAALALLLRMEGIPSRIVVGYVPQNRNPFTGWHNIRFKDAHAWTEAYFPDEGWVEFDATPLSSTPAEFRFWRLRDMLDALDHAFYSNVISFDAPAQRQFLLISALTLRESWDWIQESPEIMFVFVGLFTLWWLLLRFGNFRLPSNTPADARKQSAVIAAHFYAQMLRALRRMGFRKAPQETPLEFLEILRQSPVPQLDQIAYVTDLFCETRYGDRTISPSDRSRVKDALHQIQKAGKGKRPGTETQKKPGADAAPGP
jgi:hypothetical protein